MEIIIFGSCSKLLCAWAKLSRLLWLFAYTYICVPLAFYRGKSNDYLSEEISSVYNLKLNGAFHHPIYSHPSSYFPNCTLSTDYYCFSVKSLSLSLQDRETGEYKLKQIPTIITLSFSLVPWICICHGC